MSRRLQSIRLGGVLFLLLVVLLAYFSGGAKSAMSVARIGLLSGLVGGLGVFLFMALPLLVFRSFIEGKTKRKEQRP